MPALTTAAEGSAHPRDLAENEAFRQAVAHFSDNNVTTATVIDYARGANWPLAAAALASLIQRADRDDAAVSIRSYSRFYYPWPLYFALRFFLSLSTRPPVGEVVLGAPEWWVENPVVHNFLLEYFQERVRAGDPITFGEELSNLNANELGSTEELLRKISHSTALELLQQLSVWKAQALDRKFLQSFGRFWIDDVEQQLVVEHAPVREHITLAHACITHSPPRSVLVVGDSRSGKTAFLRLVMRRALQEGWSVFEAGSSNLMAGQEYIGQLEERLRRLATELGYEKKVLWYVPDFLQLALSRSHRTQAASILDQIFSAIASGRVIVISEATPTALTKLLQAKPALRAAVEIVRLRPLSETELETLARLFTENMQIVLGIELTATTLQTAMHLARHYLGAGQAPGAVIDLLKLSAQQAAAQDEFEVTDDHVLNTLGQLTGMPRSILDDRQRVDLQDIQRFFAARVMGQEEAVAAVVDRVAMLKAGLTDPSRPVAVFLFAGPTGTGKTELAKTLAAYLFGSPERMLRLDMSEFQTQESTRKIIGDVGDHSDTESLTQRIRKQPFAVVLLDEFEKAHPNIWDLFLQVFDDGRLTDASGHTADFRHAIIILTSNLGATTHQAPVSASRHKPTPSHASKSYEQLRRVSGQSSSTA